MDSDAEPNPDIVTDEASFLAFVRDRRLFLLDEKAYRRFTEALDGSPADNPRLRRLLATRAPWEK